MSIIVGGENEILQNTLLTSQANSDNFPTGCWYSSGRACLYYILQNIKLCGDSNRVLIPSYLCHSVISTIEAAMMKYVLYDLNERLSVDIDGLSTLYKRGDVVVVVNYFGMSDVEGQITQIRSIDPSAIVVVDNVQAYYQMDKPTMADYSFSSLRKWFAVPDGGQVLTNHSGMMTVTKRNTFAQYKIAGSMLKSLKSGVGADIDDVTYLELFERGETLIDDNIDSIMSVMSQKLYGELNFDDIAQRRVINSKFVIEQLRGIGVEPLLPLQDGYVPLCIPILLDNRDEVRRKLMQNNIFCPVHWPCTDRNMQMGCKISKNELSLIVDQRYTLQDLLWMTDIIKQCI